MKKVMMLFCAVAFLSLGQAFAQTTSTAVAPTQEATETSKPAAAADEAIATTPTNVPNEVEVAVADLPEAVQTTLKGSEYEGWTISKAFHVKKDGAELYKVILTRGDEERKVKMHADGKLYEHTKEKG